MKKAKWALIGALLCGVPEAKPMTTIDFIAVWIACSYSYKALSYWVKMHYAEKSAITPEEFKKLVTILQRNQLDIQVCKKQNADLAKQVNELIKKIRSKKKHDFEVVSAVAA